MVPKLLLESYHYGYNDDSVAKMFATGERVPEVFRIPVELLTYDMKRTKAYHDYVDEIKVKHSQPAHVSFMVHVLTIAEIKQHQVNETQDLSLAKVDDAIPNEHVKQMVEGEDIEANSFVDTVMLSQPGPDTRLEP
ncbi:hypothetical protein Tco_0717887 [Tanacetum coccineum]